MTRERNEVTRVLVGTPSKHKHIWTLIELKSGDKIILREAEMSNIVRAFIHILTHPITQGIELQAQTVRGKEGFALTQLLETKRASEAVCDELATNLGNET